MGTTFRRLGHALTLAALFLGGFLPASPAGAIETGKGHQIDGQAFSVQQASSYSIAHSIAHSVAHSVAADGAYNGAYEGGGPGQGATPGRPGPAAGSGHPKLQSVLGELASVYETWGPGDALALAEQHGIKMNGEDVRVVVETRGGEVDEAARAATALGAKDEARSGNLLQIGLPMGALFPLAELPPVTFVRLPLVPLALPVGAPSVRTEAGHRDARPSLIVGSEGVAAIGADAWQRAGFGGQGIKIAIIDVGFFDYQSKLGTELPPTVAARSFRADGDLTPPEERHGTAVAEIVHDVAPEADLLLINFGTDVEWANAIDFAVFQGVDIISSSVGFLAGPFDGTGFLADKVTGARNAGVFWAQSAGNYARGHWGGDFSDPDGNSQHSFAPGADVNAFSVAPGGDIDVILSWNDWPLSDQDYDLSLLLQQDGQWVVVDESTTIQSGSQPPFEIISGRSRSGGTFGIAIRRTSATRNVRLELFAPNHDLQFPVGAGSLAIPADSPGAVAAGATRVDNDQLESFSSQGPTLDGRTKPDLAAPDGVSTASFGPQGFFGTSASAPHLAGAAALVKSANRSLGPAEIQAFLEQRAIDMGPPGKDNLFGAGRLDLGPPGAGQPGPPPALSAADAKIEIVFPHNAAGNPTGVTEGALANIGAFLFAPNSLIPVPCNLGVPLRLLRALNNGVAEEVAIGTPQTVTRDGKRITVWEFNNVDVGAATDPLNKYYFFLATDGLPSHTNVWSHGADARTIFPQQDILTGIGPLGSAVDARIEIVFPHDAAGVPTSVVDADLANIGVDIFAPGTLISVPPDADLTVRLFRSSNNDVQEFVGTGRKQIVDEGGLAHPRWLFDDVDVSASRNPINKYYFRVVVDGVTTRSNVWSHGADARTIFPEQDVPSSSCQ